MQAIDYYRVCTSLWAKAPTYEWSRCVRHVMPDLLLAKQLSDLPDDGLPNRICWRAKIGVLKLASAHSMYITPRGVNWFSYSPPGVVSMDVKSWYTRASQAVQKELESCNFYSAMTSVIIDRIATGTGLMLAETNDNGFILTHIPAGTYAIAENKDHQVDTVVRRFKMSAHQLAQEFGEYSLSKEMQAALRQPERRFASSFEIWHLTMPRNVAAAGNRDAATLSPLLMDYVQVYIDPASKTILREDGYPEWPYFCSRYLKYGHQEWGESALAPIVNIIEDFIVAEESIKTIVQAQAYPRVLSPANLADELDLRAGGVTIVPPENWNAESLPREWASNGNGSAVSDLMEQYCQAIDDALHINALQNVSMVERQMTATEAQIREREKLLTLSETFTQFCADMRPLMDRLFCLAFRMGLIPADGMPDDIFRPVGINGVQILAPGVVYIGRLAKLLESSKMQGLQESIAYAIQMTQATQDPAWMDFFKPYECMQFITDESNVPTECLRKPKEAQKLQEQREKLAEAQAMAAMQQQDAAAARDYAAAAQP